MDKEQELLPSASRPDLDEFLSALGGFLEKQTSPQDPSYVRFLSMFCRSVGATEGHFLRRTAGGNLDSVVTFGLGNNFDEEFNRAHAAGRGECPQDEAFAKKEVVAIVELQKDDSVPAWFMALMNRHHLKSLVAVPLLGQGGVIGILCAYYKDICLFDQNTMDHLMMIGRMVGAATENSAEAERAGALGLKDKMVDKYLDTLTGSTLSSVQIFQLLVQFVANVVPFSAVLGGPVRKASDGVSITLAAVSGLPTSIVAERYDLPPFAVRALNANAIAEFPVIAPKEWGMLAPLLKKQPAKPVCLPLLLKKKLIGVLMGWSHEPMELSSDDALLLNRLVKITALGLPER